MSTKNDRDSAISIFFPRRLPTRSFRRDGAEPEQHEGRHAGQEAARRRQNGRRERHDALGERHRRLHGPHLVDLGQDWQRFGQGGESTPGLPAARGFS